MSWKRLHVHSSQCLTLRRPRGRKNLPKKLNIEVLAFYCRWRQATNIIIFSKSLNILGVGNTLSDSIKCLNFAEIWFNSIFDWILLARNSIQTVIKFKINFGDSIQKIIQFNSKGIIDTGQIREVPKTAQKVSKIDKKCFFFIKNW